MSPVVAGSSNHFVRILKRTGAVLGLLFLIGFSYRLIFVYRIRGGTCTPATFATDLQPPQSLRVMTYNIQGHAHLVKGDHLFEIAEVINRLQPDVVGLQEVHRGTWQARFTNQAQRLAELTGMRMAFIPSFRSFGGGFGNAVLVRGDVVSSRRLNLPSIGEPRSLLETVVSVRGGQLAFYVTHLASWGSLNKKTRADQVRCIATIVGSSARPFALVGDFNAELDDDAMQPIVRDTRFLFSGTDEVTHRLTGERIDFVFVSRDWAVSRSQVVQQGPSDHWPVIADLVRK